MLWKREGTMDWKVRLYRVGKGLLAFVEGRGVYTMIMHDYLHYSPATLSPTRLRHSRTFAITLSIKVYT